MSEPGGSERPDSAGQPWGQQPPTAPPPGPPQPAAQQPGAPPPARPTFPPPGGYPPGAYPPQGGAYPPGGYPPGAYPGSSPYGAPPSQPGYDGFSIAALIFGVIGGVLFGIAFGIVGIVRTQNGRMRGRGMAIAGLVLSVLWLLLFAAIIVIAVVASDSAHNGRTGGGTTDFSDVVVGDCLSDPTEGIEFKAAVVPCSQSHQGQVFAIYDMSGTTYPGQDETEAMAEAGCQQRMPAEVRGSEGGDDPQIFFYYPRDASWSLGDREVICVALTEGTPMSRTLAG